MPRIWADNKGSGGGGDVYSNITNTFTAPQLFPDGSTANVAIGNDGDPNTGLIFDAADQIGLVTGGTKRITLSASLLTSTVPMRGPTGSVSSTTFQLGAANTGTYSAAASRVNVAAGGLEMMSSDPTNGTVFKARPAKFEKGHYDAAKLLVAADFSDDGGGFFSYPQSSGDPITLKITEFPVTATTLQIILQGDHDEMEYAIEDWAQSFGGATGASTTPIEVLDAGYAVVHTINTDRGAARFRTYPTGGIIQRIAGT